MNLVLDIGNTRSKVFLFAGEEIRERSVHRELSSSLLKDLLEGHPQVRNAILTATGPIPGGVLPVLEEIPGLFLHLGPATPLPVRNLYRSKETLGYDRIAAVVEAHARFPQNDVLVIDAGTALTFDLITATGDFLGGNISPGLQMRFRALAGQTRSLPLVTPEGEYPEVGTTTEEAIRAGVVQGMLTEIDGTIDRFAGKRQDMKTILTGGDAFFFDKKLKNSIFVLPDLTAYGLNRILEFNAQETT